MDHLAGLGVAAPSAALAVAAVPLAAANGEGPAALAARAWPLRGRTWSP